MPNPTAGETGFNDTVSHTHWSLLYSHELHSPDGTGVTVMKIGLGSGATYALRVRVRDLHGRASAGTPIRPGQVEYFRVGDGAITRIEVKGQGGSPSEVDWGPVSATWNQ